MKPLDIFFASWSTVSPLRGLRDAEAWKKMLKKHMQPPVVIG